MEDNVAAKKSVLDLRQMKRSGEQERFAAYTKEDR